MMKFLAILLIMSISSEIHAEPLSEKEFFLSCKVLDQTILAVKEGKPFEYSSYEDGLKNGDTFNLDFTYESFKRLDSVVGYLYSFSVRNEDLYSLNFFSTQDLLSEEVLFFGLEGREPRVKFTDTWIYLSAMWGDITLKRYYKDDWHLLYTFEMPSDDQSLSVHTLTANCLDMPNEYSEMIIEMSEINDHISMQSLE